MIVVLFFKKIWNAIILLFAHLEYGDMLTKVKATVTLTLLFNPLIWLLSKVNEYVIPDKKFIEILFILFMADLTTGMWKHWKEHNFSFKELYTHLLQKVFVSIVGMTLFNTLAQLDSGGDAKVIVDYFKLVGKVFNALYVGGSAFSNLYIITGGKFPPVGFMKRLKKFNESADVTDLTKTVETVSEEETPKSENI